MAVDISLAIEATQNPYEFSSDDEDTDVNPSHFFSPGDVITRYKFEISSFKNLDFYAKSSI